MKTRLLFIGLMLLTACQARPAFTPGQVAALQRNGFQQNGEDWMLDLDDRLLFPLDGSTLSAPEAGVIAHIGKALGSAGITGAEIDGYTDSTGSPAYNDKLSQLRAQAVAQALSVQGGMQPSALNATGFGARNPVADNGTAAGRMQNRRAVIIVRPADAQPQPGT